MLLLSLLLLAQAGDGTATPPRSKPVVIKPIDPATVPSVLPPPLPVPPPIISVAPPRPAPAGDTALSPRGNPGRWITSDDYPYAAYFSEQTGVTGFRLDVGVDGRASGCTIIAPSGGGELDATTCTLLMRRARFTPGTQDGRPVPGSYSSRVRWTFPPEMFFISDPLFEGPAPYGAHLNDAAAAWQASAVYPVAARKKRLSGRTIVLLDVDAEGKVAACTVDAPSGVAALDKAACPLLAGKAIFTPGEDEAGNPVADRVRIKLRWEAPAAK